MLYVFVFLQSVFPINRYIIAALKTISFFINICFFSCDKFSENINLIVSSINWFTFIPNIILVCFPEVVFEFICFFYHEITQKHGKYYNGMIENNLLTTDELFSDEQIKVGNENNENLNFNKNRTNINNKNPIGKVSDNSHKRKNNAELLTANKKAEYLKKNLKSVKGGSHFDQKTNINR